MYSQIQSESKGAEGILGIDGALGWGQIGTVCGE